MPVKRKIKNRIRPNLTRVSRKFKFFLIFFIIILVSFGIIKFSLRTRYFKSDNRLTLVFQEVDGTVVVSSIDPVALEIVNISIPGNTEVEVAGGLGKWKLRNVWQLGLQEKKPQLLASTLTSYLSFPVASWSTEHGRGLVDGGMLDLLKGLFLTYRTNLSFGDKVRIVILSRSIDDVKKIDIDLTDYSVVKKSTLNDGTEGYVITGLDSPKVHSYFGNYYLYEKPTRIMIKDNTQVDNYAKQIGHVLEVMGGKIASVVEGKSDERFLCKVGPNDDKRAQTISALFDCELVESLHEQNFDVVIELGKDFAQYY